VDEKQPKEDFSKKLGSLLPALGNHKQLIVNTGVLIVLVFFLSGLTTHIGVSLKQRSDTQNQIAAMETFVQNHQNELEELNKFPKDIISQKDIDKTQSNIMFEIQSCDLDLISMREETRNSGEHGKAYTATFSGSYEDTMRFLDSLHENHFLIGVKAFKIEAANGKMNTTLTYKIYAK
jgi:hypothetical protein